MWRLKTLQTRCKHELTSSSRDFGRTASRLFERPVSRTFLDFLRSTCSVNGSSFSKWPLSHYDLARPFQAALISRFADFSTRFAMHSTSCASRWATTPRNARTGRCRSLRSYMLPFGTARCVRGSRRWSLPDPGQGCIEVSSSRATGPARCWRASAPPRWPRGVAGRSRIRQ